MYYNTILPMSEHCIDMWQIINCRHCYKAAMCQNDAKKNGWTKVPTLYDNVYSYLYEIDN